MCFIVLVSHCKTLTFNNYDMQIIGNKISLNLTKLAWKRRNFRGSSILHTLSAKKILIGKIKMMMKESSEFSEKEHT